MASIYLQEFLPNDESVNHFPALRQLITCDAVAPPPTSSYKWERFMHQSCANITSVHTDCPEIGVQDWFQLNMDCLTEFFPSLNDLVFFLPQWNSIIPHITLPPSVSYLGLHFEYYNPPVTHFQHLFIALRTMVGSKLKAVRLLNADIVEDLRENHESFLASELAEIVSCITFCIEDHEGHPLLAK